MSDDINRRLENFESALVDIDDNLNKLYTKVALLEQSISILAKQEEKQQQKRDRIFLFAAGSVISAVVAWVIRGGLGS